MLAYSAFGYLLRNTRAALATSYAYVNPIVALALGAALAGERVTRADLVGLALVLSAVALVALGSRASAAKAGYRPAPCPSPPASTTLAAAARSRSR